MNPLRLLTRRRSSNLLEFDGGAAVVVGVENYHTRGVEYTLIAGSSGFLSSVIEVGVLWQPLMGS